MCTFIKRIYDHLLSILNHSKAFKALTTTPKNSSSAICIPSQVHHEKNSQLPFGWETKSASASPRMDSWVFSRAHAREISCKRNQPGPQKGQEVEVFFCGIMHGAQGEKNNETKFESWWIALLLHLLYVTFKVAISWKGLGCQEFYGCCIFFKSVFFFWGGGRIILLAD